MHILIADNGRIPAEKYGGTERVIWYLGKELNQLGHKVTYLVKEGSSCPFAQVIEFNPDKHLNEQIPNDVEIAHFHYQPNEDLKCPVLYTNHGNRNSTDPFHINTVFVSENHARRYGSAAYVHNGLYWNDYGRPEFESTKKHFHFLGNAAWKVKNVKGAIDLIKSCKNEHLAVIGGNRFNFRMGMRFTFHPRISFYGMIGGEKKIKLIKQSKGLIFPVRWHEPFGLAIIESMYFGKPVFATPYGAIPELMTDETGFLSNNSEILKEAILRHDEYSASHIHQYAADNFNSKKMAENYLNFYYKVLNDEAINANTPILIEPSSKYLDWY